MPLIVDGYNLLRYIQGSDEEFMGLNEAGLCRFISQYVSQLRERGHVYFDGTGPRDKSELGGLPGVEVYFSGPDREADDLIEQKIEDNTAPRRLVVVSSDRRIATAAKRRKAVAVRSDVFWMGMVSQLESYRPASEPREKRSGISEIETDQWMDCFGIED